MRLPPQSIAQCRRHLAACRAAAAAAAVTWGTVSTATIVAVADSIQVNINIWSSKHIQHEIGFSVHKSRQLRCTYAVIH
jgi:hypothetical protein